MGRLTREEIEKLRDSKYPWAQLTKLIHGLPSNSDAPDEAVRALCDLALRALSLESVREEARRIDDALAEFTEYFVANYPGPSTIISNPKWHASKIFRAAERALQHAPARVAEGVPGRDPIWSAAVAESPAKEQPGEQKQTWKCLQCEQTHTHVSFSQFGYNCPTCDGNCIATPPPPERP